MMLFKVTKPLEGRDTSSLPSPLASFPLLDPASAVRTRRITLDEADRASDGFPIESELDGLHWSDPVTEDPTVGSTEAWELINTTGDAHPIHVHLVQFQILDRPPFDYATFESTGQVVYTGPPQPPDPNERPGLKDTIRAMPGFVNRIIAKFDLPIGTPMQPGQRFRYVFHCHIAEHEDNEMMRPYEVVAPSSPQEFPLSTGIMARGK
jgi:spore coat protein A, manganese oxidase